MIFFHNQLMKSTHQLQLYLVSNPIPFERYEDHEAALYIQLHELIEEAQSHQEDPRTLIESYLGVSCPVGTTADELTAYLFQTGEMMAALHALKENWHALDTSVSGESLMYLPHIFRFLSARFAI